MDKKTKAPTEPIRFDDFWNEFKVEFLPFVEWVHNAEDDCDFIDVTFKENAPVAYKNKWAREQYKIQVIQGNDDKILSAGKKLFTKLKSFMIQENKLLMDLALVRIIRFGSGFETDYTVGHPP